MVRVRLTSEPDGSTCLESPYHPDFIDGLKQAIDYGGRSWDVQRKRWLISALYTDELEAFLEEVGAMVHDARVPLPPPIPPDLRKAFDTLYVAYNAPLGLAEVAYKFLARQWHPDMGGQAEDFRTIHEAIEIIRAHLKPSKDHIPF